MVNHWSQLQLTRVHTYRKFYLDFYLEEIRQFYRYFEHNFENNQFSADPSRVHKPSPRMFARTWPKILSHVRLRRAPLLSQRRSMRLIVCQRELCRDDIPQSGHVPPTRNPPAKCNLINRTFAFRRHGVVACTCKPQNAYGPRRFVIKFLSVSPLSASFLPTMSRHYVRPCKNKNTHTTPENASSRISFRGKEIPKNYSVSNNKSWKTR